MHKVMCINHHHYDAEQYSVCPHCGAAERISVNAMSGSSLDATTYLGADGQIYNGATNVDSTTVLNDPNATTVLGAGAYYGGVPTEKRCCNCFQVYKDINGMCPHCGYTINDMGKELYYLKPGTIVGKRYIIGQSLGAGGFGITYKAWDNTLQSIVAVKEFFPGSMVTRASGERNVSVATNKENEYVQGLKEFLVEARIMSRFSKNENICNTYDFFQENNTAYIVMEFLQGSSLKDYLKNSGYWPTEEESVGVTLQILAGLAEIHKMGIVHLDIAPDNIWILPDGRVKIIDFGAARQLIEKQQKKVLVVKRGFAPYEQYLAKGNIGPWTDIYATGATLYYLLTKRVPTESSDRYSGDSLEEPSSISLASQSVSDAVMRALAVTTELRYHNVKEFADDLKKDKVRSVEKEIKRRRRKKIVSTLSILMACLVLIAGCLYAALLQNRMIEETVTVWIASEATEEATIAKQERYLESIELFRQKYPQITVNLEVKNAQTMADEFLNTEKNARPDMMETEADMNAVLAECSSLEMQLAQETDLLSGVVPAVGQAGNKLCPLGISTSVLYIEKGKTTAEVTEVDINSFLSDGKGYCNSGSEEYFTVRDNLAGRYTVLESQTPQMVLEETFSVYSRNANKESAAFTLLSYLLTDAAQDILHIQNKSTSMPVSKGALDTYLDIYTELEYLETTLGEYPIVLDMNE